MIQTSSNTTARAARAVLAAALLGSVLTATLTGCVPLLVVGAATGGSLVAIDRRTTGTQLEDEGIELKAAGRARSLATLGHINVTSYNRLLLITGEVPTDNDKDAVGRALTGIENVRSVVNELTVAPNSSVGQRTNDTAISGKVKATLLDAKDVQANAYKVVTERGVVYLMGRVTEREAKRGADLASAVSGVQKVVRVFEILSEDELGQLGRAPVVNAAPATTPAK